MKAIEPIEAVLCGHNEKTALLAVDVLSGMVDGEASLALARQSVFSPWEGVRYCAAQKLASRDLHTFVPELLGSMGSLILSRAELYRAPTGRLVCRHAFGCEGREQNQLAIFDTKLAYKPVLRTTEREPEPLVKFELVGETIRCSGGHPFWVSGKGWVKARNLEPSMRLHATNGTQAIDAIEQTGLEETYNLIVADFHTYFVGQGRILSHDNTIREPTVALVPGLKGDVR